MTLLCDTRTVPAAQRRETWARVANDLVVPHEVSVPREVPFTGWMRAGEVGPLKFVLVEVSPQTVRRTPKLVASTAGDFYVFSLKLRGSHNIRQDGREAVVRRGEFAVYDCSRPYTATSDEHDRSLSCLLPRDCLPLASNRVARVTGTPISARRGIGRALAPFLYRLAQLADRDEVPPDLDRVVGSTVDLLASLCESQLGPDVRHSPSRTELLLRIRAYIEANLHDPTLSPQQIAAAHYISTSYLYKLLAPDGTSVARLIRDRRLERCRQQLCDPVSAHVPVKAIASRWGLPDRRHFSRLFLETYGSTPTEYRRDRLAQ
jgi:AraC-like DNA-binding protein